MSNLKAIKPPPRDDLVTEVSNNPFLNIAAAEEDPHFVMHRLLETHKSDIAVLHKTALTALVKECRVNIDDVFRGLLDKHQVDIAEAVKAAASSEDVLERLSGFNKTVEGVFKRFNEAEAKVAAIAETFKRSARLAYVIHGLMLLCLVGAGAVTLMYYTALGALLK